VERMHSRSRVEVARQFVEDRLEGGGRYSPNGAE
jgi:hypothetical protein